MKKAVKINRKIEVKFVAVSLLFIFLFSLAFVNGATIENNRKVKKIENIEEKELLLEDWMINTEVFENMVYNSKIDARNEKEISLEAWMIDPVLFGELIEAQDVVEDELVLESWMHDEAEFSKIVK